MAGWRLKYVMSFYDTIVPEKLQFFFALSRTHHGVLDMMAPVFAALVYLGHFPDPRIVVAGVITVFSGYTAVYALNDIAGYRDDKKNIRPADKKGTDLDSILIRHPLAQGVISLKSAALWAGFWSVTAILGAYYLNPVCLLIFLGGALLEIGYCYLLKISYLRIVINGFVKAAGPVAAVFAVDTTPDALFLGLIFGFFFLWEAGGQNIPNDYTDIEEDRQINAKTLPLVFGRKVASSLIMGLLVVASIVMTAVFVISPVDFGWFSYLVFGAGSFFLLLLPAQKLRKTGENQAAMTLFNKASYYPFFLLCVVLMNLFL
jgi:4-hydroxybenzoate polyprenyltransferase